MNAIAPTYLADRELKFSIRRSAKRKTIELVVERDGSLAILAPINAPNVELAKFVRDKRMWIYRKFAERDMLSRPRCSKEFVTGESFSYLGRKYRLQHVDFQDRALKLLNGRFRLRRSDTDEARSHFIVWYCHHGRSWLTQRVSRWSRRMAVEPSGIVVRELGKRWGSCGKSNKINFHWAVMTLPVHAVDYLIVHELSHIKFPSHDRRFWQCVARTMPDYEQHKTWLDERGGQFASL